MTPVRQQSLRQLCTDGLLARPVRDALGSPAAASATAVLAATALPTSGTTTVTTGITNPDVPRNVTITGNAVGITGNVVVTGTNKSGQTITETIAASGTATVAGNKAFKTVTSVQLPTRNAGGDTISIGTGTKLGLSRKLTENTVLFAFLNGVKEGTAPTVAVSGTALESNTVILNSTLNGTAVVVLYLTSDTVK
jgi:hypothetical protein